MGGAIFIGTLMTDPSGDLARPSRRARRLINFVTPQLQANEQIELVLSLGREKKWKHPIVMLGPMAALVVTTQRVFEIRLQRLTARPKMTLATQARESVTAEWIRDAGSVGLATQYGPPTPVGKLSISSPTGTRDLWFESDRDKDRAQAIAAALNIGRT